MANTTSRWGATLGLGLGLTLALGSPALAQVAPRVLGLDDAVAIALEQHPTLAQLQHLRDAATARVDQDRALGLPQLGLGVEGQLGNPNGTFTLKAPDVLGAGNGNISMGTRLTVPGALDSAAALNLGQAVWNPSLAARRQLDQASEAAQAAGVQFQAAAVIRDAKLAYLEALRTARRVAIARQVVKDRDLTLAQAKALARAGLVAGLDVQQAQVRLQSAQADEILAQNNADTARSLLFTTLGYSPTSAPNVQLVDPGAHGAADDNVPEKAPGKTPPALELARLRQAVAGAGVGVAEAATKPRVSAYLNAGLSPSLGSSAPGQPLYGGGLELNAPLFTSGLADAQVAEARAQAAAAAEEARGVSNSYDQSVQVARIALARDRARFDVLDAQAGLARKALELARQRYRYRLASFLDVVTAETAVADVESRRTDAGYQVSEDRTTLAFYTGSDLAHYAPGGLQAVPAKR